MYSQYDNFSTSNFDFDQVLFEVEHKNNFLDDDLFTEDDTSDFEIDG